MRHDIVPGAAFPDYELSRPDWDISSVAQRAAWAKGDKANFYPYGKTQAQVFASQD